MSNSVRPLAFLLALFSCAVMAEPEKDFDYFSANRIMIRNGLQAVLMCNGLFTSHRTLEQIFAQELAYLPVPVGSAQGGNYHVDTTLRAVAVGGDDAGPVIRAVFREGIGCVVMAPQQTFDDIDTLPAITMPPVPGDHATIVWPDGDLLEAVATTDIVDPNALQAASDWAFDRATPEQVTVSLIVLHRGDIIHERYAPGFDMHTRTRTWSTAKSIAVTLIGALVERKSLSLDSPVGLPWLPELPAPGTDPRNRITLRQLLNMSSGLYPVDSFDMEYATGSGLSYWAGASSVTAALGRGAVRDPGSFWDYENYDTLLAVYAMKLALGSDEAYREFPRNALLDKIGMRNTVLGMDRFGDFILSSQVYSNARDLARFGLLYLQGGRWHGEQLVSPQWIDFIRTPAPATATSGNFYGGQWWLVPDDRTDIPGDAYATRGNRGQYVVVVPSHDIVIVRRGLDYGKQGFDLWDLTREVLKAIKRPAEQ